MDKKQLKQSGIANPFLAICYRFGQSLGSMMPNLANHPPFRIAALLITCLTLASCVPKETLSVQNLTLGVVEEKKGSKYESLKEYLESTFDPPITVTIDNPPYEDIKKQVAKKTWDIAFTYSPMISIAAEDNGYLVVGRMFPKLSGYYKSAMYVRNDSPIQALSDIKPSTIIGLGTISSASTFYVPVYTLYGLTLRVDRGHRSKEIAKLVASGKVDIGTGQLDKVKKDPNKFRIIHISRDIPGSGVYLSPNLTPADRETLIRVLANVPEELRSEDQANYDMEPPSNHDAFRKVVQRSEQVLRCANFNQNPVDFFCRTSDVPRPKVISIEGTVQSFTYADAATGLVRLTLVPRGGGSIYQLLVNRALLSQIPLDPVDLAGNNKKIRVSLISPKKTSVNTWQASIDRPQDIVLLEN